tara:strand:+ start:295 stop:633 length:339 start_codon:yes stop_codon:yes gene_type:complete
LNLLTLNTFYKREFIFIIFLLFSFLFQDVISASKKRSIISGVEVKAYKKERKHIETSALLCALAINGNTLEELKENLEMNFKTPISKSDKFLINDVMNAMCPEFDNRKIFEN